MTHAKPKRPSALPAHRRPLPSYSDAVLRDMLAQFGVRGIPREEITGAAAKLRDQLVESGTLPKMAFAMVMGWCFEETCYRWARDFDNDMACGFREREKASKAKKKRKVKRK